VSITEPHIYYSPRLGVWVLGDPWVTAINGSILTIPSGFGFDLASVPRILNPIIQKWELGTAAPLKHDYCYQRQGVLEYAVPPCHLSRCRIDRVFLETMKQEGVAGWRRVSAYWVVRLFGGFAWRRIGRDRKPLRLAPLHDPAP
jgi:hypothetical protein